ncbi:MAG TPA: hypothetical protein VMV95_00415 [Bacillota bacterium]|nr:hypothetical protein [Bacillota bacterium]
MGFQYQGKNFMTDDDLKVDILSFWPRVEIQDSKLKEAFLRKDSEENLDYERNFLGGDEIIAYFQSLVSHGMDFSALEEEIQKDMQDSEKSLKEIVYKKTATGIGRGHSLGGLSGVVLGIHGTKMIDSGLTGLVASRSLVTSSRRRETTSEDIVVPKALTSEPELLEEYLKISREVFNLAGEFKEKFKTLGGIETFNKLIPYNNPADLFIVLPLDTLATLAFEVMHDKRNPNGNFVPREIHNLVDKFPNITKEVGLNTMYEQRVRVPRDTYLHYTVFKDPSLRNEALEGAEKRGMPLKPVIIDSFANFTPSALLELKRLRMLAEKNMKIQEPAELVDAAMGYMLAMRAFVGENNESVRVKVLDSLSWRVWSEQKRHATLRQSVESVYSAAERSAKGIGRFSPDIHQAFEMQLPFNIGSEIIKEIEKSIIIDERLKKQPELLTPYLYYTSKQLGLFRKMLEAGIEPRDALYIVPKNIRLRTLENYDLINLTNLELPLRLCNTCEPERKATSWEKRELIAKEIPELDYFLFPKCGVGFCTEGKYCGHLTGNRQYSKEFHEAVKEEMLGRE